MSDDDFKRRKSDRQSSADEISEMIRQEGSLKDRSFLLVLQAINNALMSSNDSLMATASAVRDMGERLDAHEEREEKIFNQGKGAWRVLVLFGGIAQAVVLTVVTMAWRDIALMSETIAKHETRLQLIEHKPDSRASK